MKKILIKINEFINKGKFPFAVFVIGLPNVFIIKNTGYEFTSRNGNEIITKTIEAKYFLYFNCCICNIHFNFSSRISY